MTCARDQLKTNNWSAGNFKKLHHFHELYTWAHDAVMWHWSADTLFDSYQLITTWMSNTKFYTDSIKVCHLASANMKGWTYVRMYMYSIQTIFSEPKFFASIDYHIFLPLVLRCACSAKIHVKCKHDIQDCIIIQVYITIQPTTWVGPYMYALSGALCDL